jgi:hypothetical protein
MDTLAPAVADAFRLLQQDLYRHLDGAEASALSYQDWEEDDIDAARELIPNLVMVLRRLLLDHQARPGGDCQTCTSAWPCPVVTLIHSLIKDPDSQFVALADRERDAK